MIYRKKKTQMAYDAISFGQIGKLFYHTKQQYCGESDIPEIQSDIVTYRLNIVHRHATRKFHFPIKTNAIAEHAVLLIIVYSVGKLSLSLSFSKPLDNGNMNNRRTILFTLVHSQPISIDKSHKRES